MSADNWAVCPRCLLKAKAAKEQLEAKVAAGYGVMSLDEFDALRAEATKPIDEERLRTFREDYEFYLTAGGEWNAVYGGGCEKCGLKHEFRAREQLAL